MTSITAVLPAFLTKISILAFNTSYMSSLPCSQHLALNLHLGGDCCVLVGLVIVLEYFCEAFCRVSFSCSFFYHLLHEDEEGLLHRVLFKQLLNFGSKLRSRPDVAKVINDICVKYFWARVKLSIELPRKQ